MHSTPADSMEVTVRVATVDDVPLLVELTGFVQGLHVAAEPAYFHDADSAALEGKFREHLAEPGAAVWIACLRDAPIGYLVSFVRERSATAVTTTRRFLEIDQIGVHPAFRRNGLARALVKRALVQARERGIEQAELVSWSFNTEAHAAFDALGFRPMVVRFRRPVE